VKVTVVPLATWDIVVSFSFPGTTHVSGWQGIRKICLFLPSSCDDRSAVVEPGKLQPEGRDNRTTSAKTAIPMGFLGRFMSSSSSLEISEYLFSGPAVCFELVRRDGFFLADRVVVQGASNVISIGLGIKLQGYETQH
jgi:hypothetical protein